MASLYTKLIANTVFPLHERLKGHTSTKVHQSLERSQWYSKDEILALQAARLRNLLSSVSTNVPYYRDCFKENNIDITAIQSVADLPKIPMLTKKLIRENSDAMKSQLATGLSRFNTGGSSGEPLVFYIGKERVSHDVAAKWRATRWWDVDIGDREIVLWGSPIELGGQDYVKAVRDQLLRTRLLPAFSMSESKLDQFIRAIRDFRPKMLFGYPSAFQLIAQRAQKLNMPLDKLGLKVVFVTSERLYPHQRELIESVFNCPVANGYGGRDAGFIAHQCPQGQMHITAEDIIVEIVGADDAVLPVGQSGEIVITHLATQDYPFIRYRTGDVGVLSDQACGCGRGLPVLQDIQGRTTDFIIAADGTIMHGLALIYVVRDLKSIDQFKIIQESLEHTRIQIVPTSQFTSADEGLIIDGFRKRLGPEVKVEVERVTEICAEKSGKMRYVISKVDTAQFT